ncbi:unnamed protein product [Urochloa humidicola]
MDEGGDGERRRSGDVAVLLVPAGSCRRGTGSLAFVATGTIQGHFGSPEPCRYPGLFPGLKTFAKFWLRAKTSVSFGSPSDTAAAPAVQASPFPLPGDCNAAVRGLGVKLVDLAAGAKELRRRTTTPGRSRSPPLQRIPTMICS